MKPLKILVCDNAGMIQENGSLSCSEKTGDFGAQLVESGVDVSYFQFALPPNSHTINHYNLLAHGVKCIPVKYSGCKYCSYLRALYSSVLAVKGSDFVYQFVPSSFIFVSVVCLLLKKPYGFYVRGMKKLDTRLYRFLFRHAKVVLTVSDVFTNSIRNTAPNTFVETIKPMVDLSLDDMYHRNSYRIPEKYNITYLARLEWDKGLRELVAATIRLRKEFEGRFCLNIYGDGGAYVGLQAMIAQNKLDDVIQLKGAAMGEQNVLRALRDADIYVLPSYHEGFPRTLYEAMMSGVPIVTTMVGGIPGLMKDEYNSLAITPQDVSSIVEQLTILMRDYEKKAPVLTQNAYDTVSTVFDSNRPPHPIQLLNMLSQCPELVPVWKP